MHRSTSATVVGSSVKGMARLASRHAALARQVEDAQHVLTFDDHALHALKKLKLQMKDEMLRLSATAARPAA